MRISAISLSVFRLPGNTGRFDLVEEGPGHARRWVRQGRGSVQSDLHVLHVRTDEGIEGICTVGDARYTAMRPDDLEQLRILALGAHPFDRERLYAKLRAATRGMFTPQGWFGAFDNCLWDIAGKAAGLPVVALMGRARAACPAYYNIAGGAGPQAQAIAMESCQRALDLGFPALKDHFHDTPEANIVLFEAVRAAVGAATPLMHDAAQCGYTWEQALRVGRALECLGYVWFEEPLADVDLAGLQRLCAALDVPVVTPETLMHDLDLCAQWLIGGAADVVRGNGRHGATGALKLAHLAELHGTRIEFNGPGGLFGLVHAHLVCAVRNTSYYEYFPCGTRDALGKEIGLLNPPVPVAGHIAPPQAPGWGAEWDWDWFRKRRVAEL
jgi:L-alanine-DL-glutamate epimerase-like enolase superfamily enzyme